MLQYVKEQFLGECCVAVDLSPFTGQIHILVF